MLIPVDMMCVFVALYRAVYSYLFPAQKHKVTALMKRSRAAAEPRCLDPRINGRPSRGCPISEVVSFSRSLNNRIVTYFLDAPHPTSQPPSFWAVWDVAATFSIAFALSQMGCDVSATTDLMRRERLRALIVHIIAAIVS